MSVCHGNQPDHCCYVNGVACQYLGENIVEGRRWACSLFVQYGDWSLVHQDPGYIANVQSVWDSLGLREDGTPVIESCGTWGPGTGQCCFSEVQVEIE